MITIVTEKCHVATYAAARLPSRPHDLIGAITIEGSGWDALCCQEWSVERTRGTQEERDFLQTLLFV